MFKCVVLLLLSTLAVQGLIVEHDTMSAVLSYIGVSDQGPQTLVVFDIDNTIAETAGTEDGGDQWFFSRVNMLMDCGLDYYTCVKKVIPEYQKLQEQLSLVLIEQDFLSFLDQLKKMGVRIIALTARPVSLLNRVIQQLKEIGIEFCDFELIIEGYHLDVYRMQNGIIAAGLLGNQKGEILFEILRVLRYQPHSIIYIDDKTHHVKNVVEEAIKHNICKIVGIRYSRLDEKVKKFNQTVVAENDIVSN